MESMIYSIINVVNGAATVVISFTDRSAAEKTMEKMMQDCDESWDWAVIENPIMFRVDTAENLSFGSAIEFMIAGKKVARKGWNGKGMYLWLLPENNVKREWIRDPMLLDAFGDAEELNCLPSIRMKTATGEVLTGWLASQTDMLATDWMIVE